MTDGISVESRIIKYSLIGLLKMSCITNIKHSENMSLLVISWPTKTKLNVQLYLYTCTMQVIKSIIELLDYNFPLSFEIYFTCK